MGLFDEIERKNQQSRLPLAARMRPRTLDEFVGQDHFLGEGKLLRRMIQAQRITSAIFYGPPGTGKTTLAHLIASSTNAQFRTLNAASCGVKDVRAVIEEAQETLAVDATPTLLFLDELHHFNRTQQDILLPDVENGAIVLIGATTQNPFFALNAPLISRSQIFQFEALSQEQIIGLLCRAASDRERGFGKLNVTIKDEAARFLAEICDGDARRALTAFEIAVLSAPAGADRIVVDLESAQDSIQKKAIAHDASGDEHYDVTSAFIKSMRGSDPDAAIYWLARMLVAGEDPRFICRRLVIFASEDVGCADPTALLVAVAAHHACEFIGLPECQLNLAHATIHLACAPKSNSATRAIGEATKDVKTGRTVVVPAHLRDSHYKGAKQLGSGEGYKYPHDYRGAVVDQDYLPVDAHYYHPSERGHEARIREFLQTLGKLKDEG